KPNECEKVGNVTRRFEDLESHTEEIKNDVLRMTEFQYIFRYVTRFVPADECPSRDELLNIYGKVAVNSHGIFIEMSYRGVGLYLGGSMFDHSCKPNAAFVFDGPIMSVIALDDISRSDSSISIGYTDLRASTEERQRYLKTKYYFDCSCARCQDDEMDLVVNSILCPNPNCTHPTIIENGSFRCLECGKVEFGKNKLGQVHELTERCKSLKDEIGELKKQRRYEEVYKKAQRFIQQARSTFHVSNIYYLLLTYYYGDIHPNVAIHLAHLSYVLTQAFCEKLSDGTEAESTLTEALRVLSITYSKDNKLYTTCQTLLYQCQYERINMKALK
uniref:SET domain-containing protein n=1 Tax=Strigamia maritima TaxID=126957 RepID=T1IKR6_STRMM